MFLVIRQKSYELIFVSGFGAQEVLPPRHHLVVARGLEYDVGKFDGRCHGSLRENVWVFSQLTKTDYSAVP